MRLVALLIAICALVGVQPAQASRLFRGTIALPAPQNFSASFGAATLAGFGGTPADPTGLEVGAITPSDPSGLFTVDSHKNIVPVGTYGTAAPAYGAGPYPITLTDTAGHTWTATVSMVAHRWDWTSIQSGTNVDTSTENQLRCEMGSTSGCPLATAAVEGDSIVGRDGAVFNWPEPVADWRVTRTANSMPTDYAPYTIRTLPNSLKVHITCEHPKACTIRTLKLQGGTVGGATQATQGFWFDNINWPLPFVSTNFIAGQGLLNIGSAQNAAYAEFVEVSNSDFSSTTATNIQLCGGNGVGGILTGCTNAALTNGITSVLQSREIYIHDNTFHGLYDSIALSGNLDITSGGSGYVTGTYTSVAITGGTGTGMTANLVVSAGGAVTQFAPICGGGCSGYTAATSSSAGDVLSVSNTSLGGTGSGFSFVYGRAALPTDFFFVGNTFHDTWDHNIQTSEAANVFSEWNFGYNHLYPGGGSHGDWEIRQYAGATIIQGTYNWGDMLGDIMARATGFPTYYDGQGMQSANDATTLGVTKFTGANVEGNVFVGTFNCGLCISYLDSATATIAFNTVILNAAVADTPGGITNVVCAANINCSPPGPSPTSSQILLLTTNTTGMNAEYNATQNGISVSTGATGTPTTTGSITVPVSSYASAFTAPAYGTSNQTIAQVVAAWAKLPGGILDHVANGNQYDTGAVGTYFDFVNRISTAPF